MPEIIGYLQAKLRMKQYLLSIYQPPEVLDRVMRAVDALVQEIKASGASSSTTSCWRSVRARSSP